MSPTFLARTALVALACLGSSGPAAAQTVPAADILVARESVHPSGFPRIVLLDAPGSDLVTFRLSIPIQPGIEAATAAPILQRLARGRIAGGAKTLGARVETGASAVAISYTVTGALADLDQLTYLLRQATVAPRASEGFAAARNELEAKLTRIGETGEGRVESRLRAQAAPGEASLADIREQLRRLSFDQLGRLWQASHDPESMTLVVVGDVATPVLLAAVSGLGASPPPEPPSTPLPPSPPVRDDPDLLRRWVGFAWVSTPPFNPRAIVAASLAARRLERDRDGYEAYVNLWQGRDADVLSFVGSAYGRDATALRGYLQTLPTQLASGLDDGDVSEIVRTLHWNLLKQARTPWGRANLVGRFLETGAAPDAARRFIDQLVSLTSDDLRAYFEAMAASSAVQVEEGS